MGLVTQSIKNLKGGISQQPDILRFPNQGGAQVNGWSSESQGLQKRPPTVFRKRIGDRDHWGSKPLVHLINRDEFEQYFVVLTGSTIEVVGLDGKSYPVTGLDGYQNCANPRSDLRLVTAADYTFIVNRTVTCRMGSTMTHPDYPALNRRALIAIRGGQYGRTLSVTVNNVQVAVTEMPSGVANSGAEVAPMVAKTDAQNIAGVLAGQINAKTATSGLTATVGPGHILLTSTKDITQIATADGYADQLINAFVWQAQTFAKLPSQAPDGYIVEITGEATRTGDNYWVRYDSVGKVWRETVKPGIQATFDAATMPRALIRKADGTFNLEKLEWKRRNSGDEETNPLPSFIDGTLNDVFFFRNRLGFISGENVILSRTARYFDFFPPSVAALSDDDPIDNAVSHNRISVLKYAVPFSEQLLLWSDQAQFVLTSQGVLSAKTMELPLTTEFDVSDGARPFGIGRGVYFASPRAAFTSLKRYYAVQDVSDVKSAEDISAHVPSYIENFVYNIHGSGTENYVTALSDGNPEALYIYKFLYIREEIAQQAWSHWEFGDGTEILAAFSIGSYMHLILKRPFGITVERLEFTAFTKDFPTEPYRTYMDAKVSVVCDHYDEDANRSRFSLASMYGGTSATDKAVYYTVGPDGELIDHLPPEGGWAADPFLYLNGDRTGQTFTVGIQFEFMYEFSKLLIKRTADDGTTATEDTGRYQLRKAWVNYEQSGAFEVTVNNKYVYVMAGGRLGSEVILGQAGLGTGQFRFPVTGNARNQTIRLISDTPNPLNIIGAGHEGNYVRRASGV